MARYISVGATYYSSKSASDIELKIKMNAENVHREGHPIYCFDYGTFWFIRWIPEQSYGMQVDFYFELSDDNGDGTMVELKCSHALSPKLWEQAIGVTSGLLAGTGCVRKKPENAVATMRVKDKLSTWWATIEKALLS